LMTGLKIMLKWRMMVEWSTLGFADLLSDERAEKKEVRKLYSYDALSIKARLYAKKGVSR